MSRAITKGTVRRKVPIIPALSAIITGVARHGTKTARPTVVGQVPPERAASPAPIERPVAKVPKGHRMVHVPVQRVARVPAQHAMGPPPNPRKPKLVRDIGGGVLRYLFALFPDLPRPRRPGPRVPARFRRNRPT
jgi:hypothetical protein